MDAIRKARKDAGLTQEELASRIGVNRATLSKYENGDIEPSISQLTKIAEALDISLLEIFPQHKDIITTAFETGYWEREAEFHDELKFAFEEMDARKSDPLYKNLVSTYRRLNADGQREAVRHIEIIAGNPIYQRENTPKTPQSLDS